VAAVGLMALSAWRFQVAYASHLPLVEPVLLMVVGAVALGLSTFLARPNLALPAVSAARTAVRFRVNGWYTGLGIAALALPSVASGKQIYVLPELSLTTHTQFWALVVGLTLTALGLSGWQFPFRLPSVRWTVLLVGFALIIVSALVAAAAYVLPLIPDARTIVDTLLFWTTRAGNILLFCGIFLPRLPFDRVTAWIRAHRVAAFSQLFPMVLLAQPIVLSGIIGAVQSPWFWIVGLALIIGVLWFGRKQLKPAWVIGTLAALLTLTILAYLSGDFFVTIGYQLALDPRFWGLVWLVILANLAWSLFYAWLDSPAPWSSFSTKLSSIHFGHYALLLLTIGLAIFTRFYLLNDTMRFLVDEDAFIGATHYLRAVPKMQLLVPFSSVAAFPYVVPYWQVVTIDLFGRTLFGLRATSGILGVLTVPAVYLLARTLFDRKTALLAALLMATLPVHVQFSRIGISEVASPIFGTLAFAFVARGLLQERRRDYVLGGVMLGLTHYFHEGGRLLYTPLMLLWIAGCLILRPRPKTGSMERGRLQNLIFTLVALVIVAAPIYYTLIATDRPLFARMVTNNSGLGARYWSEVFEPENLQKHLENHVLPAFQVYLFQIDNTRFYAGDNGLIPPLVVPAFLLGLVYAFARWRAPGTLLLLMWVFSTSVGNSLMVDSAGSPRYVMVFPALVLTAAVGIRYTAALLIRHEKRQSFVLAVVGIGLALGQVDYYFNHHLPLYNDHFRAASGTPDGYDSSLRSAQFPTGTYIHIISYALVNQIESVGLLGLMRDDLYLETLRPGEVTKKYIDGLRCRVDHAFFLERNDFDTLRKLRKHFFLRAAASSPYDDILPAQRLILYYAPYIKGSEALYDRDC
jgi:4-amino-4-deoxy-L-arabinose transferase-like glycosyltransferase